MGEDLFGDFILRALEAEGTDVSSLSRQEPPVRTSLAFVEISPDGDRSFTFYRSTPAAALAYDALRRDWTAPHEG